jgi:hypothetical protein
MTPMPAESVCLVCGRTFAKKSGTEFDLCPTCLQQMNERHNPDPSSGDEVSKPRSRRKIPLAAIIIIGCAVIIVSQVPNLKQSFTLLFPPSPTGANLTADPRDLCIANLWNISSQLQKGVRSFPGAVCPLTQKPYRIETVNGNIIVSCPNPGAHRLKILRVSRNSPTPEVATQ